jgi:enamine deaminase RidA (YjgF/YER057c/UK114 family)
MSVSSRLQELGIVIPEVAKPLAAYLPAVQAGDLLFISGQLPRRNDEVVCPGRLGREVNMEQGMKAAELAAINCLAVLKAYIGEWESLLQIVKITGYIQCREDFDRQADVLNGASELLEKIFGAKGRHARAAVGVNSLPLNAACEIEMIARVK